MYFDLADICITSFIIPNYAITQIIITLEKNHQAAEHNFPEKQR